MTRTTKSRKLTLEAVLTYTVKLLVVAVVAALTGGNAAMAMTLNTSRKSR